MSHQFSFDPIDMMDAGIARDIAHKEAAKERNAAARDYRKQGVKVLSWTLTNQLRPYKGLGQPDGTVRNVYMLNVADGPYQAI